MRMGFVCWLQCGLGGLVGIWKCCNKNDINASNVKFVQFNYYMLNNNKIKSILNVRECAMNIFHLYIFHNFLLFLNVCKIYG